MKKLIEEFLNKRENQILLGVILLGLIIRLYFFFKTFNQSLWWDEADYMALAKSFTLGTPEMTAPWRARGMSVIFGILYYFGANEIFNHLVIVAFSTAAVYITYLFGKEMYTKKVGLIAAVLMSFLWIHLFWATRFSAETMGLVFFGAAAYLFWKGYVKNENKWYTIISGALIGYGIFLYESVASILLFLFVFLLVTEKFKFLKNKKFWYGLLGLTLILCLVFMYYYNIYGQIFPRVNRIIEGSLSEGAELDQKLATEGIWSVIVTSFTFIVYMPDYLRWPLLIFFCIGLTKFLNLILGFDILIKNNDEKLKKDFFVLWGAISLIFIFGVYLAVTKAYYEPRYLFPAYPFMMIIAAQGILVIADTLEKHKQKLGTIAIIVMIIIVGYSHLTYANSLIENKMTSFSQEPAAGQWLKEHTNPGDRIYACTQAVPLLYYSERYVGTFRYNLTQLDEQIANEKVKYIVVDLYYFDCNLTYINERQNNLTLVQTYNEGDYTSIAIFETKGYY